VIKSSPDIKKIVSNFNLIRTDLGLFVFIIGLSNEENQEKDSYGRYNFVIHFDV